jgi:Rha family phage regulatory protein
MNELITINTQEISLSRENNTVFANTRDIAKVFGKRHADVIRGIESIAEEIDFTERKIALSEYVDKSGKANKFYKLDRDMFSELVMGFTGKEAKQWKRDYIKAYNTLEKRVIEAQQQLMQVELKAKDRVIKQLSEIVKDYKKITKNNIVYISANGLADDQAFTAKGFRTFMKDLKLIKKVPKLTYYWEATEEGLDSQLVIVDANGTPYYNHEVCTDLYLEYIQEEE